VTQIREATHTATQMSTSMKSRHKYCDARYCNACLRKCGIESRQ